MAGVYRTFTLRAPLRLSWRQVYRQFGVDPARASDKRTVQNFRCEVLRELKKIKLAGPELRHGTGLINPPALNSCHPSDFGASRISQLRPFPAARLPL